MILKLNKGENKMVLNNSNIYELNRDFYGEGSPVGGYDNENNNHNKNTFLLFLLLVGTILYFLYLLKYKI